MRIILFKYGKNNQEASSNISIAFKLFGGITSSSAFKIIF